MGGALVAATAAVPAHAAVSLASLGGATVQTLIDLGGDGVTAGGERYYDFSYFGSATAPGAGAVRVQGIGGTGTTAGLRFVAPWAASGGAAVSSTVGYNVEPVDPKVGIGRLSLSSNGTAPSPAAGTFATATLQAGPTDVADLTPVAPVLTTFDDGQLAPVDTTAADVDASGAALVPARRSLAVTDTVTVASRDGGVATASVVQNLFTTTVAVPEPGGAALMTMAVIAAGRRRRTTARIG